MTITQEHNKKVKYSSLTNEPLTEDVNCYFHWNLNVEYFRKKTVPNDTESNPKNESPVRLT